MSVPFDNVPLELHAVDDVEAGEFGTQVGKRHREFGHRRATGAPSDLIRRVCLQEEDATGGEGGDDPTVYIPADRGR